MVGKVGKIWVNLSGNTLKSGYFIQFSIHKNWGHIWGGEYPKGGEDIPGSFATLGGGDS